MNVTHTSNGEIEQELPSMEVLIDSVSWRIWQKKVVREEQAYLDTKNKAMNDQVNEILALKKVTQKNVQKIVDILVYNAPSYICEKVQLVVYKLLRETYELESINTVHPSGNKAVATAYLRLKHGDSKLIVWDDLKNNIVTWSCGACGNGQTPVSHTNSINGGIIICDGCFANFDECKQCSQHYQNDNLTFVENWIEHDRELDQELLKANNVPNKDLFCPGCYQQILTQYLPTAVIERRAREREEARRRYNEASNYSAPSRPWSPEKIASKELGDTVGSPRLWSCEVEHYSTHRKECVKVYKDMPKAFGLSSDGSLRTSGMLRDGRYIDGAYEIQTALLGGKKGETVIRDFLGKLSKAGGYVDATCGLHIHIDMTDVLAHRKCVQILKNVLLFHLLFEDVLVLFLPSNRRNGQYCQFIAKNYSTDQLSNITEYEDLMSFWYRMTDRDSVRSAIGNHYQKTRYQGVNFHPLWEKNNIEIRHHSGTLNAQKILEWVNLHTRIIDYCMRDDITIDTIQALNKQSIGKSIAVRMHALFSVLDLSDESRAYFSKRQKKFDNGKIYEGDMSMPDKKMLPADYESLETNQTEVSLCVG